MQPDPVANSIFTLVGLGASVVFKWVPVTLMSLFSFGPDNASTIVPITTPVTVSQVADYLSQSAATPDTFVNVWALIVVISIIVSLTLIAFVTHCVRGIIAIRRHEQAEFDAYSETVLKKDIPKTQLRWERIMSQVASNDEQSWRFAILESDIMLNELLDVLGYRGETMGDKMRNADRIRFNSIDIAWEAHRLRNKIAHEGAAFTLTSRDVHRAINQYETVFREFQFIK